MSGVFILCWECSVSKGGRDENGDDEPIRINSKDAGCDFDVLLCARQK